MGNIWSPHRLVPHPDFAPRGVERLSAQIRGFTRQALDVEFSVMPANTLALPAEAAPVRADDLWQNTCFEVFLRSAGSPGYFEMNFSPSFAWAGYRFEGYREGRTPLPVGLDPEIWISGPVHPPEVPMSSFFLAAEFEVPSPLPLPGAVFIGLSAIIEERDGTKSWWALKHPPGKPDFHHPDCFALELPAPEQA